jgi:hypothetical protein
MYICPLVEKLLEQNNFNKLLVNITICYLLIKVVHIMSMTNPFDDNQKNIKNHQKYFNPKIIYYACLEIISIAFCLSITMFLYRIIKPKMRDTKDSIVFFILFNIVYIINKLFLEGISHRYQSPISNFIQLDLGSNNNMGLLFDVISVNLLLLFSLKISDSDNQNNITILTLFVSSYYLIMNTNFQKDL